MTARKKTQGTLADSEDGYQNLFAANPHPMWVYDLETLRFLAVNDAAIAHYGYSHAEFLRMTIADIRPPEDVPQPIANIQSVSAGIDVAGVWRHRKLDGTAIQVEIISHTVNFGGRKAELVLANDITERKQVEATLRDREERLRLAIQASNVGLWDWNLATSVVNYSREWKKQIGYAEHEIAHEFSEWERRVHPDDLALAMERIGHYQVRMEGAYEAEFRLRHKDGSWRWIYSRGQGFRDADGKLIRMLGCHVDITERKQTDEGLRLSEQSNSTLLQNLSGMVYHCRNDTDWTIDFISDGCFDITGYRSDELRKN